MLREVHKEIEQYEDKDREGEYRYPLWQALSEIGEDEVAEEDGKERGSETEKEEAGKDREKRQEGCTVQSLLGYEILVGHGAVLDDS